MGKCKFDVNWLTKRDTLVYVVSDWYAKKSDHEFFCKVCMETYTCQKGWYSIVQHVGTGRHQVNAKYKIGLLQLHLAGSAQLPKQSPNSMLPQPEPLSGFSGAEVELN